MVVKAAVKITTLDGREHIIPCHRHGDAFRIIKEFNIQRDRAKDVQGFICTFSCMLEGKEKVIERFMTRNQAYIHAFINGQIEKHKDDYELFSEDLW